ncbi:MAG TPA: DUF6586 family protein [Cellvibrionaceae bacterium]
MAANSGAPITDPSASLASRVNQRMACARLLLVQLQAALQENTPLPQVALQDSCIVHLYAAFFHYLREVCQYHGIKNLQAIDSLRAARGALVAEGKASAELDELWQLYAASDSWLADIINAYQALWALPVPLSVSKATDKPQPEQIALVNLDRGTAAITFDRLQQSIEQLQQLIERHRESSTEY